MEFAYDCDGLGKRGDVTLYYDGRSVGTGRVPMTQAMVFSMDEYDRHRPRLGHTGQRGLR